MLQTSRLIPGMAANMVTFDDVGGLQQEIEQIRELVEGPLRFPEVFETLGIETPRGILLYGPPGSGKTYLAKAVANEIGAHVLYINGPEIVSSLHGGTEANLRKIFNEAMEYSPSVVLIDELDAIAPQRGESGLQADMRMGTQLLSLLDGLINMENVMVIGTTNRLNSVDSALRRPGRFDREIFIPPPNIQGRLEILRIHTRQVPLEKEALEYLPELARRTHGYVGADLKELVRQAGFHALRQSAGPGFVRLSEVRDAVEKIVVTKKDLVAALQQTSPSALRETLLGLPDASWEDIGGLKETVERIREAVDLPLHYPEAFEKLRFKRPNGILLYGPPGTGKTLLAKAVAKESEANFIPVNGAEIFSKWVGQSEETVRHIFQTARQVAPSVIFLDQVDAIAPRRRGEDASPTTDRVVSQLLAEMDGIQPNNQVIVLAATNRRELLDPAMFRPGRLGVQIYVGLPNLQGRREILQILLRGLPVEKEVVKETWIARIARATAGFSGADLSALCDRAKLIALQQCNYRENVTLAASHLLSGLKHFLQERAKKRKVTR